MYHYFYKITNNINGHFYYGVHSTNDLNDNYMGSGARLHYAYKKYGVDNFSKEILNFFNTQEEAYAYESEIVNEDLIKDKNCYNIVHGGHGFTEGCVIVKHKNDIENNFFVISITDPRYISGELVPFNLGTKINNNHSAKGKTLVYDENNNIIQVNINDEKFINGTYKSISKNTIVVRDKNNNCFRINIDDERLQTGELQPIWLGKKHTIETINKIKYTHKINNHQQGEKNSQYNTCWINNGMNNKKIHKDNLIDYINNGWIKGKIKRKKYCTLYKNEKSIIVERSEKQQYLNNGYSYNNNIGKNNPMFNKCYVTDGNETKCINKTELQQYIDNGWKCGRTLHKQWMNKLIQGKYVSKMVNNNEINIYINNGWVIGRKFNNKYKSKNNI